MFVFLELLLGALLSANQVLAKYVPYIIKFNSHNNTVG